MSNRVRTRSLPFPSASMWMHRSGQMRSHWKQMMQRSLPVSGSIGSARSPWNRLETSTLSIGYFTVTLRRSITRKLSASPVASAVTARAARVTSGISLPLPVDVREHDVDASQDRDHVRDLPSLHHLGQGIEVAEGRGPDLHPVRGLAAVADEVDAEVAPGRFGVDVDLPAGRLHRHRDPGPDLAAGEVEQRLPEDPDRLPHLRQAHQIPGVAVSAGEQGDV